MPIPRLRQKMLFLKRETTEAVRRAIDGLPCNLQLPSVMRFFEEMSFQDIGRKLNISSENARKRIQHARTIIKEPFISLPEWNRRFVAGHEKDENQDRSTCEFPSGHSDIADLKSDTIKPCIAPYRLIRAQMRSGMEIELYVLLKTMPERIHQKIRTLQKYVEKHPARGKKDWN